MASVEGPRSLAGRLGFLLLSGWRWRGELNDGECHDNAWLYISQWASGVDIVIGKGPSAAGRFRAVLFGKEDGIIGWMAEVRVLPGPFDDRSTASPGVLSSGGRTHRDFQQDGPVRWLLRVRIFVRGLLMLRLIVGAWLGWVIPRTRIFQERGPNADSPSQSFEWEGEIMFASDFIPLREGYAVALSSGLRQIGAGGKRIRAASIAVLAEAMKPSSSMAWSMLECPISSRTRPAGLNVR